jgi:hypothetical protein
MNVPVVEVIYPVGKKVNPKSACGLEPCGFAGKSLPPKMSFDDRHA